MALRHAQAQHEILLGDARHRLAGQDHGAGGDRDLQHAAGGRRQYLAFGQLLLDHRALGDAGAVRVGRNIESGARLVEAGLRDSALGEQVFGAGKIALRLRQLRLQPGDLRIERLQLQHELLVADGGNDLALLDFVAFLDGKLGDGAADAGARRHHIGALDGGEHGLLVGNRLRLDRESLLRQRLLGRAGASRTVVIVGDTHSRQFLCRAGCGRALAPRAAGGVGH